MASIFTSAIQSHILSLLISRLPLQSIDIPQQSSLNFGGVLGPSIDLHDLKLDIEKLESQYFPPNAPFNVQSAFLKNLNIVISRSGIRINLSDIILEVSPKLGIDASQYLDPSGSIFLRSLDDPLEGLEGMMGSVVGFVDAVSGVNSFASGDSQTQSEYNDEIDENEEDSQNFETTKCTKTQKQPEGGTQNSIVKYTIEYILGKINVQISNFQIKSKINLMVLYLNIEKITANGDKENRRCSINGIELSLFNSALDSMNVIYDSPSKPDATSDSNHVAEKKVLNEETDVEFEDAMMNSSFMATSKSDMKQSMIDSAMYSTGRSLYLSAIADSKIETADRSEIDDQGSSVLFVDVIEIQLKDRRVLSMNINNIKLSLMEFPALIANFVSVLIDMNIHDLRKPMEFQTSPKPSTSPILDRFCILNLQVGLNTTLVEGAFLEEDSFILYLRNILFTRRSSTLMQGSLDSLNLKQADTSYIYFVERKSSAADITLEIQREKTSCSFSLLIEKLLKIEIPFALLELIAQYLNEIHPLWEKITQLHASNIKVAKASMYNRTKEGSSASLRSVKLKATNTSYNFTINSANTDVTIYLDKASKSSLNLHCAPITSNPLKDILMIDYVNAQIITPLGSIIYQMNKIRYVNHNMEPAKFKDYDINLQKPITSSTSQTISVDVVEFKSSFSSLQFFLQVLDQLKDIFLLSGKSKTHNKSQKSRSGYTINSSTMFSTKRHTIYLIVLKTDFKLTEINKEFGDVTGSVEHLRFTKSVDGDYNVSLATIHIQRDAFNVLESIVSVSNASSTLPSFYLRVQDTCHIFLNNLQIMYSGKWLAMFDSERSENEVQYLPEMKSMDSNKKLLHDIHLTMRGVSIGLRAVSLECAAILQLENSNMDILLYNDKSLITQLTTDVVNVFLIDDYSKRKEITEMSSLKFLDRIQIWEAKGYKHIGKIVTLLAKLKIELNMSTPVVTRVGQNIPKTLIDMQINIDALKLFVCSDSFNCFLQLLKDLKKPIFFSYEDKYKDENETLDLLKDIEENFFDVTDKILSETTTDTTGIEFPGKEIMDLNFVENYFDRVDLVAFEKKQAGYLIDHSHHTCSDAAANNYVTVTPPINVHVTISKSTINLYDGYDWKETRDQIQGALERVITKAKEVRDLKEAINSGNAGAKIEVVLEETLYDSILVEFGVDDDPGLIYNKISRDISGLKSENLKSVSIDYKKRYPLVLERSQKNKVSIKLSDIDIDFKLLSTDEMHLKKKPVVFNENIDADDSVKVFELALNVSDFQIVDNVPTSSWHLFVCYMREAGEKEIGKNILQLSIEAVRPIDLLAAVEMILDVKLLPLRFYIDQDTLDFLTRFFNFKDSRFVCKYGEVEEQFIQKLVVDTVKIKIDYKPKTVDYAGLKSGKTGELANIFVLDGAEITLNKVKLYGISGFSKLSSLLSAQWSPDVKRNQLSGVLSSLAPVRSIYNIGYNINSFISLPINEYRRDGGAMRGLQVGVSTFTKATGTELLKLGAKLAAGTQTILENAEEALGGIGSQARLHEQKKRGSSGSGSERRRSSAASFGDEDERDYQKYYRNKVRLKQKNIDILGNALEEECAITDSEGPECDIDDEKGSKKVPDGHVVSLYANQPASLNEGLKVAFTSVQRNLKTATDAVYEASLRASVRQTTTGAFVEIAKVTPIIFIRPVIAATEAVSKTLLGGVNELSPSEKERSEEKYKTVGDDDILSDSD
ncbi:hypothetical protein CANINC_004611 [Pichia inconspicua]|uniref:Autophagy-related protein 2 n=1 Tax=Pichia inconspicua TaxID=52247 RepID=A0A4T0WX98_9ASCO|nr:hypothetical protein CANINC_004611 [[Candida] inconspicua]